MLSQAWLAVTWQGPGLAQDDLQGLDKGSDFSRCCAVSSFTGEEGR